MNIGSNPFNVSRSQSQPLGPANASHSAVGHQSNPVQQASMLASSNYTGLGPNVENMSVSNFGKKGIANTIGIG